MKAEIRIVFLDDGGIEIMSKGNNSIDTLERVAALYAHMNHFAKSVGADVKLVYGALSDFMQMIDDGAMNSRTVEIRLPKDL